MQVLSEAVGKQYVTIILDCDLSAVQLFELLYCYERWSIIDENGRVSDKSYTLFQA